MLPLSAAVIAVPLLLPVHLSVAALFLLMASAAPLLAGYLFLMSGRAAAAFSVPFAFALCIGRTVKDDHGRYGENYHRNKRFKILQILL